MALPPLAAPGYEGARLRENRTAMTLRTNRMQAQANRHGGGRGPMPRALKPMMLITIPPSATGRTRAT